MSEEESGQANNSVVDLELCNRILKSERFKGLIPIIVRMDKKNYYRITQMKTRTSKSVFKILEQAEINYKVNEAGVLKDLSTNLKKWSDLLLYAKRHINQSEVEAITASTMRYMPPSFFERLDNYRSLLNEKAVADFMPILEQAKNLTSFYSDSIFWRYKSSNYPNC